ncbi:glycosyltransferase family 4 protein [Phenylobacterium sp. J367]|uniref:glycosyltransferase family 4 protein n=1 Tax=Phenylobacterium sp. J367 TaxID=2898435 RepID=UPI00215160C8|nr:glycosyltransferase family 4 protein [Phenylobacterium sp. J367]MCR5877546.1 glycosyltransferase family 4 protein [Phenylobacterium sp. J367]
MTDTASLAEDRWRRFQAANRRRYAARAGRVPPERILKLLARGKTPGRTLLLASSGAWHMDLETALGSVADEPHGLLDYVRAGPDPAVQPKALFDQAWYLDRAPGLAGTRWAPLAHYLVQGDLEGRWPHPLVEPKRVRTPGSRLTALQDFLFEGAAEGRDPHPLFYLRHYVGQCEAVARTGENPLSHYLREGWRAGLDPHPDFAGGAYLNRTPGAAEAGIAPLLHHVTQGAARVRHSPAPPVGAAPPADRAVTLVGYPFSPTGMGEHLRVTLRSLQAAGVGVRIVDVARTAVIADPAWAPLRALVAEDLGPLNVFCVNADEIGRVVDRLGRGAFEAALNVVYPAWELARYPAAYARALAPFDEIWAPSAFVRDAIAGAVDRPVQVIPLAVQPEPEPGLGRAHFGIPEDAFAVLFFFDFASHAARKNPEGVLAAVERLAARRPEARLLAVVKVRGTPASRSERDAFQARIAALGERARLLEGDFSDAEIRGLVGACDAFVSLHRSEGFGRGPAEAMALGRPAIATGYSGTVDFMPEGVGLKVDFTLVPVPPGAYPHGEGQVWAEPSAEHASRLIESLIDDPEAARALAERSRAHIRETLSYAAVGRRLAARVQALRADRRQPVGSSDR